MKDINDLLYTKGERALRETFASEAYTMKKRLFRQHRSYIETEKEVIDGFFGHPYVLQIETISNCNAKCVMCPTSRIKRKRGTMDDRLFEKIVKDSVELKPRMIWPFLNGEPFLDPKIFQRLDSLSKVLPEQNLGLFTNASLLNEDKICRLFEHNIKLLNISINAASKETYEKIMGLDYGKLLKNLELILKHNRDALIAVSLVVTEENRDEVEEFKKVWKDSADTVLICALGNWSGKFPVKIGNFRRLKNHLVSILRPPLPCIWQIMNMFILSNGKVCHCCGDSEGELIVGSADRESLFQIWSNQLNRDLRYKHLRGTQKKDISICRNCNDIY